MQIGPCSDHKLVFSLWFLHPYSRYFNCRPTPIALLKLMLPNRPVSVSNVVGTKTAHTPVNHLAEPMLALRVSQEIIDAALDKILFVRSASTVASTINMPLDFKSKETAFIIVSALIISLFALFL